VGIHGEMQPKVGIIVLAYNQCQLTLQCLHSLADLDYPSDRLHVIVVDNGSTDSTVEAISERFPQVTVLRNNQNMGYSGGNNVGICHALKQDFDYLCLLNNDTILDSACLQALINEAESSPDIGMVGPKMYFFEPDDMVFAAGSMIDWRRGWLDQRGLGRRESEVGLLYTAGPEDVHFIVGCCVLVKRRAIEQIGLLDPSYFLNFEDVDWCIRARNAGFRIRYVPKALLWHKVSASLGQASPRNTYYMTRNALLFFGTHLHGWRRWRTLGHIFARNVKFIAAWTIKPEYRKTAKAKRDANIMALRDAVLGRFGEMAEDVKAVCERS
jgi:GT2 family glycosyltransferase